MTQLQPCPVCFTITRFSKRVYVCEGCGHRYRPEPLDPIEFHDEVFRDNFQRDSNEFSDGVVQPSFHEIRQEIVKSRLIRIKKFLKPTDTVLDVGGGAGTFANAVRPFVAEVEATEVSGSLVAASRELGITTHQKSIQEMKLERTYDVVFAWHVLEHCEPLQPAAERLISLFTRYLIIEIPKERGAPEKFDGHFHFFSEESLQLLFSSLVVRQYGDGVQKPARLAVFEKTRSSRKLQRKWG